MNHQDGRCASAAESLVVTSASGLPSTSVPAGIRLVAIRGNINGSLTWSLPTSPQMTIVGQNSGSTVATLTGIASATTETATIKLTSGDLYIRGLSVTAGSPGIWATGGILRLDHVNVSNNTAGGILLDGAGFDIKDTTINNNGPNTFDSSFGGIRVQNIPSTASVPKSLALSTVTGNLATGVSCATGTSTLLTATGTLVSSNTAGDVGGSCGFTSCSSASATCGAQP
jgi:hypothetical protein